MTPIICLKKIITQGQVNIKGLLCIEGFNKKSYFTVHVSKTNALISCAGVSLFSHRQNTDFHMVQLNLHVS